MCIYFSDQDDLTYKNQEHIFPAGLGGIGMLPRGYVSDQANALFSPLRAQNSIKSQYTRQATIYLPETRCVGKSRKVPQMREEDPLENIAKNLSLCYYRFQDRGMCNSESLPALAFQYYLSRRKKSFDIL